MQPESGVKECDSSVGNELFCPMWDEINLKDGVVESGERACDPVVNNYTSERTGHFMECLQFRMRSQLILLLIFTIKVIMILSTLTLAFVKKSLF